MQINKQHHTSKRILTFRFVIVMGVCLLLLFALPTLILSLSGTDQLRCDIPENVSMVEDRLEDVGLSERSRLRSTGIKKHIDRLCDGQISLDQLYTYANQIEYLVGIHNQQGESFPATLWDVQTAEMKANNITEYDAVNALASFNPSYLALQARAYDRLVAFKQNEANDTALDAALDIFLYTVDYVENQTDVENDEVGGEIIRIWQQLIGSTTRNNPLTGDLLFPIDFFTHFSITNMWRHQTGRINESIGDIWEVSGFDDRFVGERINNNQVEHLSMSIALQYVFDTSLLALNALEYRDVLSGRQSTDMSLADQNINNIVAYEFITRYNEDRLAAIDYLRCVLSNSEANGALCVT